MSVLVGIERKTVKGRIFLGLVTLALVLGGVTMVYPFLLMVSGAMRSPMDGFQMGLVPRYFIDDSQLTRKFLEYKYNHNPTRMNEFRGYQDYSFLQATIPEQIIHKRITDFEQFVTDTDLPNHWQVLGGTEMYRRTTGPNNDRFTQRVRARYQGKLDALRQELGLAVPRWRDLSFLMPQWTSRRYDLEPSRYTQAYLELMHERPLAERAFVSLTGPYLNAVVFPEYGRMGLDDYNADHIEHIDSFQALTLSRTCPPPDRPRLRQEWLIFVNELLNESFIRTTVSVKRWRDHLRGRYETINDLNHVWSSDYADFRSIDLPEDRQWITAVRRNDYRTFLDALDPDLLYLVGPRFAWIEWLQQRYGTLELLNQAHETSYLDWDEARVPLAEIEYAHAKVNAATLRWQFATANFSDVIDEVILQGRPFINTVIFVSLSLLLTLTLQPLAAYALSRFNPPGSWRIILLFMATMAFPPMVGMIPQFLILRKLHLLNTFIALILPVIVNGYLIFLLKGFFDSLPHHLYEAALIDGASELRMFWEITMALSRPILAVVALQTFNHVWIAFMYPLLVCPDESMHVLAVWLYQFQQEAPTPAVFAAILVTSIPTLLIFIFTQRTIMRGIAVPAEK